MNKKEYKELQHEMGKDVIKAILFFFVGLPAAIVLLTWVVF